MEDFKEDSENEDAENFFEDSDEDKDDLSVSVVISAPMTLSYYWCRHCHDDKTII